jgi:putative ABC transport system permease protein
MQSKELGINIDQVMVVKAFNFDQETWSDSAGGYVVDPVYLQKTQAFSDELRNLKDVLNVASLSHLPGQVPQWGTEFTVDDLDPSKAYSLKAIGVDFHFIPTLDVALLAGRNFSRDYPSDRGNEEKRAIIINETASKLLGFRNPQEAVSRHVSTYWGANYEIIGVVRSFHQLSLKEDLTPLYFILQPRALPYFAIDLQTDNLSQVIQVIKSVWSRHFHVYPFDYLFLDDYFNRQYKSEAKFTKVTGIFTVLGIFIGCMGLFGLTSYAIVQRTKEIGIRKVLGASVVNVIAMFSANF